MTCECDFKVTLLGTGTPIPSKDRFGPCTLVEAGNQKLLIDAGRGATIRLAQLDIPIGRIDALLLTHFHSDHTVGVPDIWLTGWLESHFGTRRTPLRVVGPRGTEALMSGLRRAYADDIRIRMADERLGAAGIAVAVQEYDGDCVVYDQGGVKVIAFEVDHGDMIKPAYGYRIEYDDRSAVISGDTRFNENVIAHGAGADLLVHEVAIARPELLREPYIQRIMAHHTTAAEAGVVFSRTRPKLAVYTHLVFLASKHVPPATVADLIAETRTTYGGPLEIGEDLMRFEIVKAG
jgi:ribonuclease Z